MLGNISKISSMVLVTSQILSKCQPLPHFFFSAINHFFSAIISVRDKTKPFTDMGLENMFSPLNVTH